MWSTIAELFGCALIVAGVSLISVPASLIVAGVLILVVSYLGGSE